MDYLLIAFWIVCVLLIIVAVIALVFAGAVFAQVVCGPDDDHQVFGESPAGGATPTARASTTASTVGRLTEDRAA